MAQKSTSKVSLTVQSSPKYTTTLPQASSSSQYVKAPNAFDVSTQQDIVDQQIMMRCNIARQFPNPQVATYLGNELAKYYKKKKESDEEKLKYLEMYGEIDDLLWAVFGVVAVGLIGGIGGKVAGMSIAFLAEKNTAQVDSWIVDLEEAIENGQMSSEEINRLAFIAGEPEMMRDVKTSVSQIPKDQLYPQLERLINEYNFLKKLTKKLPNKMFDESPKGQLRLYFTYATMQITMKYICDALMGIDTPQIVPTLVPIPADIAPSGSKIPTQTGETVSGDGEEKGGGLIPLLIALGIGAKILL